MRHFTVTFDIEAEEMSEDDIEATVAIALDTMPLKPYINFSDVRIELDYEDDDE